MCLWERSSEKDVFVFKVLRARWDERAASAPLSVVKTSELSPPLTLLGPLYLLTKETDGDTTYDIRTRPGDESWLRRCAEMMFYVVLPYQLSRVYLYHSYKHLNPAIGPRELPTYAEDLGRPSGYFKANVSRVLAPATRDLNQRLPTSALLLYTIPSMCCDRLLLQDATPYLAVT